MGGGILGLNAIELSNIIPQNCTKNQNCTIKTNYNSIINSGDFRIGGDEGVIIGAIIDTFTNYGNMKVNAGNQAFKFESSGYIRQFINYGTIDISKMSLWGSGLGIDTFTNYGSIGGMDYSSSTTLTLNNLGNIYQYQSINLKVNNNAKILIQNYKLLLNESATAFNGNGTSLSHLVISGNGVTFKDKKSKIWLDFGSAFEIGKEYSIDKVAINTSGQTYSELGVNFSRLSAYNDIYTLTKSGTNGFKVELKPQYGTIGTLYKANIRTMNNLFTMSNAMIYPHKYKGANRGTKKRVIRRVKKVANVFGDLVDLVDSFEYSPSLAEGDKGGGYKNTKDSKNTKFANVESTQPLTPSAREGEIERGNSARERESIISLKSNEYFFYDNESLLLADSQNEKQKSMQHSTQNLNTRNTNQTNNTTKSIQIQNRTNKNDKYYFILTPFVNHNYFFKSGRYNLSGLEYGFITAFSGKLNESNTLGTHFMFSYGNLNDKDDLAFNIKSMNLNLGLNYKLDLIYSMYLKVRIDGYYFLNEVKNISLINAIKPNAFGFGANISYGKEWDFKDYGLLGLEAGIDYKGLYAKKFAFGNNIDYTDTYDSALYNMLYIDLGLNYDKYFSTNIGLWGLDAGLGIKANATNNALAKSKVVALNGIRSIDMKLDNDLILAYLNLGGSYLLKRKDFDMEFSIAYYGNFGNRTMSNGGGFEWRVGW